MTSAPIRHPDHAARSLTVCNGQRFISTYCLSLSHTQWIWWTCSYYRSYPHFPFLLPPKGFRSSTSWFVGQLYYFIHHQPCLPRPPTPPKYTQFGATPLPAGCCCSSTSMFLRFSLCTDHVWPVDICFPLASDIHKSVAAYANMQLMHLASLNSICWPLYCLIPLPFHHLCHATHTVNKHLQSRPFMHVISFTLICWPLFSLLLPALLLHFTH